LRWSFVLEKLLSNGCALRVIARPGSWIETEAGDQLERVGGRFGMKLAVGLPDLHPGRGHPIERRSSPSMRSIRSWWATTSAAAWRSSAVGWARDNRRLNRRALPAGHPHHGRAGLESDPQPGDRPRDALPAPQGRRAGLITLVAQLAPVLTYKKGN
jgi:hypothetical protein